MGWKIVIVLLGFALLAGCGPSPAPQGTDGKPAAFRDEREELSYLSSLANPTLDQWRRREELRRKLEAADRQWEMDQKRLQERSAIAGSMARARELEKGAPSAAWALYRDIADRYPGNPEAKEADAAARRLEQAGYAIKRHSQ